MFLGGNRTFELFIHNFNVVLKRGNFFTETRVCLSLLGEVDTKNFECRR